MTLETSSVPTLAEIKDTAKPIESDNKKELESPIVNNKPISPTHPLPPSSPEIPTPTSIFVPNVDELLIQLKQKKDIVRGLDDELYQLKRNNAELVEMERRIQQRMFNRQKDQRQLMNNYNDHMRSRRATSDDHNSIHKKLQDLKIMIKTLATDLGNRCEAEIATKSISAFWINLHEPISKLGNPLPVNRIIMLTEKFLMDVLVQNMNYNSFAGLRISKPYTQIQMWFEQYEPSFCTRLRQEIAKLVVSGNVPNSTIQQEIQKYNKHIFNSLYNSLNKAYPFIEKHDLAEKDTSKQFSFMLKEMIEQSSRIGWAMRGQETDIAASAVEEGREPFKPDTMIDEDGQTSGTVQFCVCPPFIMYGAGINVEVLEKARVLCSPAVAP